MALGADPASGISRPALTTAIVLGVQAAKQAAPDADVGFSWLSTGIADADAPWWYELGAQGALTGLADDTDFVAMQFHPTTHSVASYGSHEGPGPVLRTALFDLRQRHMPVAGLTTAVDIVVGEVSFPASEPPHYVQPGSVVEHWAVRSEANQKRVLHEMYTAAGFVARFAGVTGALWWELSDASNCLATGCNGLIRANGTQRPAFHELAFQHGRSNADD